MHWRSAPFEIPTNPPSGLKFLDEQTLRAMFTLSADIGPVPVEINRLDNQVLVRYYEGEWRRSEDDIANWRLPIAVITEQNWIFRRR